MGKVIGYLGAMYHQTGKDDSSTEISTYFLSSILLFKAIHKLTSPRAINYFSRFATKSMDVLKEQVIVKKILTGDG